MLAAVARDLRRGFGERYRILRAASGAEALELLRELRTRGDQVALLIADQRMPGMPGTDYLVEARKLVPDAKRVLLTAYADTEAAICGDQRRRARLLPAQAVGSAGGAALPGRRGPAHHLGGGRGARGRRRAHGRPPLLQGLPRPARLPRPQPRPARWLDVERDGEARELLKVAGVEDDRLPVALLEDGSVLERPTVLELAERLGVAGQPAAGSLRPRDRRRRPGRAGGRRLRRVGGPAHGHGRARGARAARPASRAGSRTTSASRRA